MWWWLKIMVVISIRDWRNSLSYNGVGCTLGWWDSSEAVSILQTLFEEFKVEKLRRYEWGVKYFKQRLEIYSFRYVYSYNYIIQLHFVQCFFVELLKSNNEYSEKLVIKAERKGDDDVSLELNKIGTNLFSSIKVLLSKVDRQNWQIEENIPSQLKVIWQKLVNKGVVRHQHTATTHICECLSKNQPCLHTNKHS